MQYPSCSPRRPDTKMTWEVHWRIWRLCINTNLTILVNPEVEVIYLHTRHKRRLILHVLEKLLLMVLPALKKINFLTRNSSCLVKIAIIAIREAVSNGHNYGLYGCLMKKWSKCRSFVSFCHFCSAWLKLNPKLGLDHPTTPPPPHPTTTTTHFSATSRHARKLKFGTDTH